MRCRVGDLAVVVKSDAGNEGKIVRCVRLIGALPWVNPCGEVRLVPTWEVDSEIRDWRGDSSREVADDQLRPIRDPGGDATDEMVALMRKKDHEQALAEQKRRERMVEEAPQQ